MTDPSPGAPVGPRRLADAARRALRAAIGWLPRKRQAWVSMTACPDHLTMLGALLPPDAEQLSLLDLGCGDATHTRQLPSARQTFVDIARRPGSPEPFVEADAIQFLRERG